MSSCRQPRCILCSSKTHHTDKHPPDEKLKCVNCKGEHLSNHKACNTRWIRLGLKPIPTTSEKSQQRNIKNKVKDHENALIRATNSEDILDIGLTGEAISSIMKAGESHQARKANTAKYIQLQTTNKEDIETPAKQNQPMSEPVDMEIVEEPTQRRHK